MKKLTILSFLLPFFYIFDFCFPSYFFGLFCLFFNPFFIFSLSQIINFEFILIFFLMSPPCIWICNYHNCSLFIFFYLFVIFFITIFILFFISQILKKIPKNFFLFFSYFFYYVYRFLQYKYIGIILFDSCRMIFFLPYIPFFSNLYKQKTITNQQYCLIETNTRYCEIDCFFNCINNICIQDNCIFAPEGFLKIHYQHDIDIIKKIIKNGILGATLLYDNNRNVCIVIKGGNVAVFEKRHYINFFEISNSDFISKLNNSDFDNDNIFICCDFLMTSILEKTKLQKVETIVCLTSPWYSEAWYLFYFKYIVETIFKSKCFLNNYKGILVDSILILKKNNI